MTKTIGRAFDNAVVINKPDIGRHHAQITYLGEGQFLVEDLNSSNGVFVNGYRVQKANVGLRDEVRLSESTPLNLVEIFGLRQTAAAPLPPKSGNKDFSVEFAELKKVWDDFLRTRDEINDRYQRDSTLIRSLLILSPLGIWFILKSLYSESDPNYENLQNSFLYFSVIGSAVGNVIGGTLVKPPREKLRQLEEDFRVRYVCPNPECRNQLGSVPWQSYFLQEKCFRCQAKYKNIIHN